MGLDPAVAALRLAVRRQLTGARGPILVACSGGADSLALLAATVFETRRLTVRVIGVVVDHALQDGSAEHTARVVQQMADLGADETASIRVSVDAGPGGLEAGAREARYAALAQLAEHFDATHVLLGHTRDDQAESVLLGLARGSGGRSLTGMRRAFANDGAATFARPLLDLTRAQTEAACRAEDIEFWVDPHNSDPRFTRSRVRHDVLPVLETELGPGVAAALARTGEMLREDMDALDDQAEARFEEASGPEGLQLDAIRKAPAAIRHRVLRLAALAAGAIGQEVTREHVLALATLLEATEPKQVQLPGHVTAYRDDEFLRFRKTV